MSLDVKPAASNLTLGGMRIFFKPTTGDGYRDLGNISTVGFNRNINELEHFTSKSGSRILDKKLIIETALSFTFNIDEFDNNNYNDLFFGNGITAADQSASSVSTESHSTSDVWAGRFIFTSFRNISALVVNAGGTTSAYTVTTDYLLDDARLGAIQIVDGGSITDNTALDLDYSYAAGTFTTIKPGNTFTVEGEARVEWNALNGANFKWDIPSANLRATGDTNFLADNWSEATFVLDILRSTSTAGQPYGLVTVNQ